MAVSTRSAGRLLVLQVVVVAVLATLLGRLWFLQVHEGARYTAAASENRVREVVTPAPRGEVYDVTGVPLVRNRTALVVSVDRARLLREPDDGRAVLERLGRVLGKPPALLRQEITPCGGTVRPPCWRGSPYQPVPVQEYAADDAAGLRRVLAVEEHREDYPAVETRFAAVREYPRGTTAAHVLGYLGPIGPQETSLPRYEGVQDSALVGRSGVEASYDTELRGTDGVQSLLVDHVGAVKGVAGQTPPRPGDTLVLSIHAGVQAAAEQALAQRRRGGPHPARPRGQRHVQGRLRVDRRHGGEDRAPGRPGELPELRPVGLPRRGLRRGVRAAGRRVARRAAGVPRHPGRLRAGVDVQGGVDGGGGRGRLPADRRLPVPRRVRPARRQAQLRGRRPRARSPCGRRS